MFIFHEKWIIIKKVCYAKVILSVIKWTIVFEIKITPQNQYSVVQKSIRLFSYICLPAGLI